MTVAIIHAEKFEAPLKTRMPFRYGIVSMTQLPHVFVRVLLDVDGTRQWGVAADHLPPKWFTKNPASTIEYDLAEMRTVIDHALYLAEQAGRADSVFDLWKHIYDRQKTWAPAAYPPLLWSFGVSLVERAIIDAFCRATATSFGKALRKNDLGIRLGSLYQELDGVKPGDVLPRSPLRSVTARHTVGLIDPLREPDIAVGERLNDGLPQSLEASIEQYGLTHFKIKLAGDAEKDRAWLTRVASVLDSSGISYRFTLDGNENYRAVEPFLSLWRLLNDDPALESFLDRLIFVEQPFHRDVALGDDVAEKLAEWPDRPPIIIDESDGGFGDLPGALRCGYNGTSHKNCKGVFKGIANAALIAVARKNRTAGPYLLSGEDLSNIGPVALLQDLAVQANLGIDHVERNGHHYFRGLSMYPESLQNVVMQHHPDLYRSGSGGFARLAIADGVIQTGTVVDAPFGYGFDPDQIMALFKQDQG